MQKKYLALLMIVGTSLGLVFSPVLAQEYETGTTQDATETQDSEPGIKQSITDAAMTARVKSQLLLNEGTSGMSINVNTRNSEVTLTGTVESETERSLAEEIARNTSGVRDVWNKLKVASHIPNGDTPPDISMAQCYDDWDAIR